MRAQKFYSLSKLQLHNTVLLTIVAMMFIRSSDLIHCIAESLYPFTHLSLFPPPPQPLATTFLLSVSMSLTFFFFLKIPHISDTTQYLSFSSWLISLSIMPSRSIHVVTNGGISFGLWRNYVLSQSQSKFNISTSWDGFFLIIIVIMIIKQLLSTCVPDTDLSMLCVIQFSLHTTLYSRYLCHPTPF